VPADGSLPSLTLRETMWISVSAPPVPVKITSTDGGEFVETLSRYGEKVLLRAPSPAIPSSHFARWSRSASLTRPRPSRPLASQNRYLGVEVEVEVEVEVSTSPCLHLNPAAVTASATWPDPSHLLPGTRLLHHHPRHRDNDLRATPIYFREMLNHWPERCAEAVSAAARARPGGPRESSTFGPREGGWVGARRLGGRDGTHCRPP
jgi:hypothetical protein